VATTFTRDLVVDVDDVEGLVPRGDVKDHQQGGGHGVGEVVGDGNGVVNLGFNVGDNFASVTGFVRGVVDLPVVVGSNSEYLESKWVGV
jgi:hypothetical protein